MRKTDELENLLAALTPGGIERNEYVAVDATQVNKELFRSKDRKECQAWLTANFPEWASAAAYWD